MSTRPNILLIMCDQLRADMLGCYGNPVVRTPNIDQLAATGVRCDRNYVANPICMPNRLSVLTGMGIHGHGLWTNGLQLPQEVPGLGHHLGAAGWQCACFGKMHLQPHGGDTTQPECGQAWRDGRFSAADWHGPYWGFEHVELMIGHTSSRNDVAHYGDWFYANGGTEAMREIVWDTPRNGCGVIQTPSALHDSSFVGERTAAWIERERDGEQPFFIWASFPDPHHPWLETCDMAEHYDPASVPMPTGDASDLDTRPQRYRDHYDGRWHRSGTDHDKPIKQQPDEAAVRRGIAVNYTEVELIDRNVGRMLDALETSGQADNTIVIFTADHGELLGDHGLWLKGPFFYEGLINTPLLIRAPGLTPEGAGSQALFSDVDLAPTIYAQCGIERPLGLHGIDQSSVLADPERGLRDWCLVEYRSGYGDDDIASDCLITAEAKYSRSQDGSEELTDLVGDSEEHRNIAADTPARTAELRTLLLDAKQAQQIRWPEQRSHA